MRKTSSLLGAVLVAAIVSVPHPAQAARDIADGVCETTSTGGPGPVALEGALAGGHRTFVEGVGIGAHVPYHIQNGNKIETGWGVVTAGTPSDTLTRVADWSTDGAGVELNLVGTSSVCIGTIRSYFTGGDGYGINADLLDGLNATDFLQSVPDATTAVKGVAELATPAEAEARIDAARTVTPAALANFALASEAAIVGQVIDYAGASCPAGFLEPAGQTVSQAAYPALYAVLGAIYGSDAGGNFTLPDLRGRVVAGEDDMGGASANRLTNANDGLNGDVLGAAGGGETQTLSVANLAPHTHGPGSYRTDSDTHNHSYTKWSQSTSVASGSNAHHWRLESSHNTSSDTHSHDVTGGVSGSTGSGTAFGIVQPTIVLRKCIYAGA